MPNKREIGGKIVTPLRRMMRGEDAVDEITFHCADHQHAVRTQISILTAKRRNNYDFIRTHLNKDNVVVFLNRPKHNGKNMVVDARD